MKKTAAVLTVIFAAAFSSICAAQEDETQQSAITETVMDWSKAYFENSDGERTGEYYIDALSTGVYLPENDSQYYYAYMLSFVDKSGYSFALSNTGTTYSDMMSNSSESDYTASITISDDTGLSADVPVTCPAGSKEWFFDNATKISGMSVSDYVITQMQSRGSLDLNFEIITDGEQKTYQFILPAYDSNFSDLYAEGENADWYDSSVTLSDGTDVSAADGTAQQENTQQGGQESTFSDEGTQSAEDAAYSEEVYEKLEEAYDHLEEYYEKTKGFGTAAKYGSVLMDDKEQLSQVDTSRLTQQVKSDYDNIMEIYDELANNTEDAVIDGVADWIIGGIFG